MKALYIISFILVIIGGLNWGLIGFFDWNLVEAILGTGAVTRTVYALVGVATVLKLVKHKGRCKACGSCGDSSHSHSSEVPDQVV